jgi:kynurenine formamidase
MSTLIDLTMPIAPGMPFNPDRFPPEIATYATVPTHGWQARRLILASHLGAHVDARAHFVEGGEMIDETPLDVLVGAPPFDVVMG